MEESDEDSEHESDFEDNDILNNVDPNILRISRHLTDDLFVGRLSKWVFQRMPQQEHVRITYATEIAIYIRFHVLPLLREILFGTNERYYIWVACNTQFKHETKEETCNRWSSFR